MTRKKASPKKSSPKKTKEWLRRSKAAKKGWVTRHKRELPPKLRKAEIKISNAEKVLKKKPKKKKSNSTIQRKETSKQAVARLKRELAAAQAKLEEIEASQEWVNAADPEYTKADGTVAVLPSRLRGLPDAMVLHKFLKKAHRRSRAAFFIAVERMAQHYDIPVREVYTLFYSP